MSSDPAVPRPESLVDDRVESFPKEPCEPPDECTLDAFFPISCSESESESELEESDAAERLRGPFE